MDLINGKTMYCPECGKSFAFYDGQVNCETAHVTTFCEDCKKYYHWVAYVSKNTKEHKITMFREYLKID